MEEPLAPVTRRDFERFAAEMRTEVAAAVAASTASGGYDVLSDVLGQLRIIKWGGGFALAAIMGAFGVLYQGQVDLREEMHREFGVLRHEIASLRERVVRLEAGQEFILTRLDELVARVGALETRRDEDAGETPTVDRTVRPS